MILCIHRIDAVDSNGIPRRRMEDNIHSNTTGLGLVGPVGHCCCCSCGRGSPQSIRIDLWALRVDPDPMGGSDPSSCIDEVSFKIKDTFQSNGIATELDRELLGP